MTSPIFCIIDPNLRDFVGHHFSYDQSVADAARGAGFQPLVLGHRALPDDIAAAAGAVGTFTDDIWAQRIAGGPLLRWLDLHARNRRFARELRAALPPLPPGSILLAHMLTRRQLAGLARVAEGLPPGVTTIALLRYQPEMVADALSARAFARMRRAIARGARIRLASDSARLAERLSRLAGLPVEVLPIPHLPAVAPPPPPDAARPMHLVSLGNARDEKGFPEILAAIELLRASPEGLSGLRFTLQANDAAPEIAAAIAAFARDLPAEVTLLPQPLPPADYAALLAASDLVLLPYWREIYEARTSGVLLEALAAGRPVICTAQSWMADELALHGAGVLVPDHDPAALAQAIRQARAAWPALAAGAAAGRAACLARHGGAALMRALASPPPPPPPPHPPRRVQLFYPWPDFAERRSGASQRINMLADSLAGRVEEVRVLQPGRGPRTRHGHVVVERVHPRRIGWLFWQAACLPLLGWRHRRQALFAWLHLRYGLDPRFHRQTRAMLASADAVLMEYGFWSWPVLRACRRLGIACVLTEYDVIEDQVTGSRLLRRLTAALEARAMRGARHLVAVTPGDAAHFARRGCQAIIIPNPVDLAAADLPLPGPARQVLAGLGIELPEVPICLFVGSHHPPNLVAVARLRALAVELAGQGAGAPLIVVAGGAAEAGTAPGFLALGRVDALALRALHHAASLALIPLPEGTGSSLKTLEAMAARLPVLGNAIAFRGLPVGADIEAVVEDDLAAWPALVE